MSDVTYVINNAKFNYRVAAVIRADNKILIMTDQDLPYFYLPGGRVKINEKSIDAIRRELQEELEIDCENAKILYINENFFKEDSISQSIHEICIYFEVHIKADSYIFEQEIFERAENGKLYIFKWQSIDTISDTALYPLFIAKELVAENKEIKHIYSGLS